jgi:hypothetical protein
MHILWIRHGFSCANFLGSTDPLYVLTGRLEYDARLTGLGYRQANEMAPLIFEKLGKIRVKSGISSNSANYEKDSEKLNLIPILFTSVLSRAIETANGLNQGLLKNELIEKPYPIVTIPYVEEIPLSTSTSNFIYLDKQNEPRNIHEVREDTGVDVDVYEEITPYDEYGEPIKRVSISLFYKDLLPKIHNLLEKEGYEIDDKTVITVVSHRKTIERATGVRNIGNIGAVLQNYQNYEKNSSELLFEGFSHKNAVQYIEESDLKSSRMITRDN